MKNITYIEIEKLKPFENHPYKVVENEEMNNLTQSIKENGILSPLIVRPIENGEYEIVSGHRRLFAVKQAGLTEIPAIVCEMDRDAATVTLVDSNLHRENILPSEKAFAYKLKAEALSHQGKRTDFTLEQVAPKLSTETIGESENISKDTVKRYIRLTKLLPKLLELVDEARIAFTPAVELSYWDSSTVAGIIDNRQYTGCTVNFKTTTVSYKVHRVIHKSEDEQQIIPNTQKPIIDEDLWLRVQELRQHKRRPTSTGRTSLFSGLVYCPDCGAKLHFAAAKSMTRQQEHFRCSNYKSGRGECQIHFIRDVVLERIVFEAISNLSDFVRCYESVFLYLMATKNQTSRKSELQKLKSKVENGKRRISELDVIISRIYEDNILGKISDERYSRMSVMYENEQKELIKTVSAEEKELETAEQKNVDMRLLLKTLRELTDFKELTPTIVNSLIQRIEVHNNDKYDGHCHVKVDIYFTAVGIIDIPDEKEILDIVHKIQENPQVYKVG